MPLLEEESTDHLAPPSAAHARDSADELLAWANGHIEALEQALAQPLPHAEALVPMLRADLEIWRQVAALATQAQPEETAADAAP